jgi:hypothetical protein
LTNSHVRLHTDPRPMVLNKGASHLESWRIVQYGGDTRAEVDEEGIYAAAMCELKTGAVREGLWAKAFAESEGNEAKSQALYIKLRVQHEQQWRLREEL